MGIWNNQCLYSRSCCCFALLLEAITESSFKSVVAFQKSSAVKLACEMWLPSTTYCQPMWQGGNVGRCGGLRKWSEFRLCFKERRHWQKNLVQGILLLKSQHRPKMSGQRACSQPHDVRQIIRLKMRLSTYAYICLQSFAIHP